MNKRFVISEEEKKEIRKKYFFEQAQPKDAEQLFCHKGNTKTLEDIMGDIDPLDYVEGIKIRQAGVNGLTDMLELLKTERLHDKISDGGEDLVNKVVNNLKSFKPYNYFDETRKECMSSMDKIIELYKENEHGEELVKDIEKIQGSPSLSPRAKEFIKHGMSMIKGK